VQEQQGGGILRSLVTNLQFDIIAQIHLFHASAPYPVFFQG
jgi:hypothetical protein